MRAGSRHTPAFTPLHSRGLIGVSSNVSYYLYPWAPGDTEDFATHKIFRMEQLFPWRGARRDKDSKYKAGMASLPHVPQSRVRGIDCSDEETGVQALDGVS